VFKRAAIEKGLDSNEEAESAKTEQKKGKTKKKCEEGGVVKDTLEGKKKRTKVGWGSSWGQLTLLFRSW
jgi:hypothetical protein